MLMFTNSHLDWFWATTIFPLVHTRRHDLMYYAGATPVCLVAGGFGAQGVVKETDVGPVCRQWNVCLFDSNVIRRPLGGRVVFKVVMAMGNNGLYDPLFHCWITLGMEGDDGMEVMTLDGDAPVGYLPPWICGLSSCLCIVVIKGSRIYAIVWCLLCAVLLVCFGTLVAMMDVTAAESSMIPMTMLSHLKGGQSECSEWLPKVSQRAGLKALPMRAHRRPVVFFGNDRNLYMCPVYTWGTSFETALVTGSLFFVAPGCRLADLSACKFGLRVSRVSDNWFLCVVITGSCVLCRLSFGVIV